MEANFGLSCRSTIVRRARARKTLTGSVGAKLDRDDDAHPVRRQVRGSMTPSPSSGLTSGTQRHAPDQQSTIAPSTLSLIFNMFQDSGERARAIALWISSFSAGSAVGPLVGGVLLEHFWWGSVFLIALPVMALLLVLGPLVLPEYRAPNAGRLDVPSAAMSLVAVLAVVFGLKQIAQDGIGAVPVASIAIGVVVGILWTRRQLASADPMIDLRLFRIPSFNASLVINFLTIFVAIGYFLFVAQYLQLVVGLSPL